MPASRADAPPRPGREKLPGGPIGEVRLEIRAAHFLEGLSVYATDESGGPKLRVCGRIAGEASGSPLAIVAHGFERELLYGELKAGDCFHLHTAAAELPYREPDASPCRLAAVEIRLLSGGVSVWQTVRETAVERIGWNADERQLSIAGKAVTFPSPVLPITELQPPSHLPVEIFTRTITVWGNRKILSETWYSALDRQNVRVVQLVPAEWTGSVCSRLAHHPSIVAWTTESDDWDKVPQEFRDGPLYGRPWLIAEEAFATS
jgi:hypothetical protein